MKLKQKIVTETGIEYDNNGNATCYNHARDNVNHENCNLAYNDDDNNRNSCINYHNDECNNSENILLMMRKLIINI